MRQRKCEHEIALSQFQNKTLTVTRSISAFILKIKPTKSLD